MANIPGLPGSQASNDGDMMRMIQDLQRDLRELRAQDPFKPMGITAQPNGITVTGSETVNGPLTVNGPMSVTGTLNLPAGIIGNDALASPIKAAVSHVDVDNFSLDTGANVEKVRATFTVPPGFTQAMVYATATMGGKNTSAASDFMYVSCTINDSSPGYSSRTAVAPTQSGHASNTSTALLTGLGSTFYVSAKASSGSAPWPAPGPGQGTDINLDAIVIFLR